MKQWLSNIGTTDIRHIVAIQAVTLTFGLLYMLLFVELPARNQELMYVLAGNIVGTLIGGVVGYLFGSSRSQDKKNEHA